MKESLKVVHIRKNKMLGYLAEFYEWLDDHRDEPIKGLTISWMNENGTCGYFLTGHTTNSDDLLMLEVVKDAVMHSHYEKTDELNRLD